MKRTRMLIIGVAVLGGAIGAWHLWSSTGASAAEGELVLYGNVDVRQVELGFRVPGRLDEVRFEEGDSVPAKAVMARLDEAPFLDDLRYAQAQAAAQGAELDKLTTGSRPEEIRQARQLVAERRASYRYAQSELKRQTYLVQTGASAQRALDDARAAKDEARARLRSALEGLELAEEGFRSEDIAATKAGLQAAEAQLSRAQTDLADTEIVAPVAGVILSRIREPGAIVTAGAPVYTMTIVDPVWVRTYVGGPDLGRVTPGMRAKIRTDTFPDKVYTGQVGFISPEAEFTPRTVETPELRTDLVYRLRVIVDNPDGGLRQGMPVTVHLERPAEPTS